MFFWLVRKVTGSSHPDRGTVDSASGAVTFYSNFRPIRPDDGIERALRGRHKTTNTKDR